MYILCFRDSVTDFSCSLYLDLKKTTKVCLKLTDGAFRAPGIS